MLSDIEPCSEMKKVVLCLKSMTLHKLVLLVSSIRSILFVAFSITLNIEPHLYKQTFGTHRWQSVCETSRCCFVCYSCAWRLSFLWMKFIHFKPFVFVSVTDGLLLRRNQNTFIFAFRNCLALRYFLDIYQLALFKCKIINTI